MKHCLFIWSGTGILHVTKEECLLMTKLTIFGLYAYLCHNVDFDSFPCPGSYIKGIPAVTFCSIVQNISIWLSLYRTSKKCTYNARSISSLVCESFFSTLSAIEISQGSPKVPNIPNMIGNLMTIENYKVPPGKFLKHFKIFLFYLGKIMQHTSPLLHFWIYEKVIFT